MYGDAANDPNPQNQMMMNYNLNDGQNGTEQFNKLYKAGINDGIGVLSQGQFNNPMLNNNLSLMHIMPGQNFKGDSQFQGGP